MGALSYINTGLEALSIIFISYVFFSLLHKDKKLHLSRISEKSRRYDMFKSSLILLVVHLYFSFIAKLSVYSSLPGIMFDMLNLVANVFLFLFVLKLYRLLVRYTEKAK